MWLSTISLEETLTKFHCKAAGNFLYSFKTKMLNVQLVCTFVLEEVFVAEIKFLLLIAL